jgi:hypothetical protein
MFAEMAESEHNIFRAREASTDDIRLACLALATAWLKAAVREDGGGPDHLPLAPSL